jgi:cytochrome b561
MTLKMYRPGPEGLEPNPVQVETWRSRLRSRRWKAAPLTNPEQQPTSTRLAVAFWLGLALLTFVVLIFGYLLNIFGTIR